MTTPFGDWRIRLGIVLGVLVFSGAMIVWSTLDPTGMAEQNATAAWWTVSVITIAALGASVLSDKIPNGPKQ